MEYLLDDQIDGLLLSVQDVGSLRDSSSMDAIYSDVLALRNEVEYYQQVLEDGRPSLQQMLQSINQGTLMEQYRLNQRIRKTMSKLEDAIKHVADIFASNSDTYDARLQNLMTRFQQEKPTNANNSQANLGDQDMENAVDRLLSESENLTAQEQAKVSAANGDTEFTVKVLSSHLFGFEVKDTDGNPISGATVKVQASFTTGTGTTDENGMVTFLVSSYVPDANNTVTVDVTIEKDGYGVREAQSMHIKGGNFATFRLTKATNSSYLRMVSFNGMDILSQQETIYYTPRNDATLSFDVKAVTSSGSGTLKLCYQTRNADGSLTSHSIEKAFSSSDSISFTGAWCSTLAPGGKVSIQLISGSETCTFDTYLRVEQAVVNEPVTKFNQAFNFLNESFNFTFPESIPFLGGNTLSMNIPMPNVNVRIDPDGHILVAYGKNYNDEAQNWKKESNWESQARRDDAAREGARDANAAEQGGYQGAPAVKTQFLGNAKAVFTPFATFQGTIGTKIGTVAEQAFSLSGYVGIQALLNADFTYTLWIWGIPTFLSMDVKFALGTAAAMDMQWDWDGDKLSNLSLKQGSGWIIDFLTELGVSAGVGIKNLFSIAVRFYGRLTSSVKVGTPSTASAKFTMGLSVIAQALIIKYTEKIWEGTYLDGTTTLKSASANAAQPTPAPVLLSNTAGVNTRPTGEPVPSPANSLSEKSLKAQNPTKLFTQLESVAQEVQYVTLNATYTNETTSKEEIKSCTFAFWITPTGDATRTAELVWYNLDVNCNGKVILPGRENKTSMTKELLESTNADATDIAAYKTMRESGTDYAFSVMGDDDMAAVTVIGGAFVSYNDKLEACSADVAVLQMDKNGNLTVVNYAQIHHAQSWLSEGTLSQPMVYFKNYGSGHYFLTAGCAEIGKDYKESQAATKVHFMEIDYTIGKTAPVEKTATDDFSDNEYMSTFAIATPTNLKADGTTSSEDVLRCFYCLGQDKRGETETSDNGDAYQANLYLYLNGTYKKIDENVSYIAPLADEYKAAPGSSATGVDGKEYLFYLQRSKGEDGADCYKLKSVWIGSEAKLTITDYGITVPTGKFDVAVVRQRDVTTAGKLDNTYSGYGTPYLYWLEYATEADDEDQNKKEGYRVRAITFDRTTNVMYGPYTLTEIEAEKGSNEQPNHVCLAPQLFYSDFFTYTNDSTAIRFFRIFYTCDTEMQSSTQNAATDARLIQTLYRAEVPLAAGVDFTGIAMEDPCVNPGSNATLLFSVENTGNLPVSAFWVEVRMEGQTVGNVFVVCNNPVNSVNGFLRTDDGTDDYNGMNTYPTSVDSGSAYTVTRVDNIYDEQNGDFWVQQVQTIAASSARDAATTTATSVKATNLLMPGAVHTYRAVMKIPDEWSGTKTLTARITNIYFQQTLTGAVANLLENEDPSAKLDTANLFRMDENSSVKSTTIENYNDNVYPTVSTVRVGDADSTLETISVGRSDLGLYCQVYSADDGKQYVRVSIAGRSITGSSTPPTLTAVNEDGSTVLKHTFVNSIDEDYAYTLDIPASTLLHGAKSGFITFTVTDNEIDTSVAKEFSDYDNQRTVWLGNLDPLRIVQHPVSVETMVETDAAFTVAVADGKAPYAYQWQRQNADGDWEDVADANEATLNMKAVGVADNGAQFRCVVTDSYGDTVTSNPAMLTVLFVALRIVQQPVSVETMVETDAAFTIVVADGKQPYAYQWQRQNADGDWEDVAGAIEATLNMKAVTAEDNGAQFRCIITDGYGSIVTSDPAMLTVITPPPATGDNAQPLLWAIMALTALLAAAWFVTKRRRNA